MSDSDVVKAARPVLARLEAAGGRDPRTIALRDALAAHDAAGKVEWVAYGAGVVYQARVGDLLLHVQSADFGSVGFGPKSTDFRWKVVLADDPNGTAPTLELAKAAAEAAARGAK